MSTRVKDVILIIAVVAAVISMMIAFNVSVKADKHKRSFEKEMAFRLDMEEKVTRLRNEKVDLLAKIKDKDLAIQKKDASIKQLKKDISQAQDEIERLQLELERSNLLKQQLEENLKDVLSKQAQQVN